MGKPTDKIKTGASFSEFALECAKSMITLSSLADLGDAELPLDITAGDGYKKELDKALNERALLVKAKEKDIQKAVDAEYKSLMDAYNTRKKEIEADKAAWKAMLSQVKAWTPPTDKHFKLQRFMINVLNNEIRSNFKVPEAPHKRTWQSYKEDTLEHLNAVIDVMANADATEQENAVDVDLWVKELRESL